MSVHPRDVCLPDTVDVGEIRAALEAAGDPSVWLENESWDEDQTRATIICTKVMGPMLDRVYEVDQALDVLHQELGIVFAAIKKAATIPPGDVTEAQLAGRLLLIVNLVERAWGCDD